MTTPTKTLSTPKATLIAEKTGKDTRQHLVDCLTKAKMNISRAAKLAGVTKPTFRTWMQLTGVAVVRRIEYRDDD